MEFRVLGPLEVTDGGIPLAIGRTQARAILAMLLINRNRVVSADRLAEELWTDHARDRAIANLHVRISELRRAMRSVGETDRLVTRAPGYLLRVAVGELDMMSFESFTALGRDALARGDAATALQVLDEALALWRGPALADLVDFDFARTEQARLEELQLSALETKFDAEMACGRHREIVAELESMTTNHPLRERFWAQRLLALYRSGRQADALRAFRQLRATLVDQLGIDPGPELRELEARILRQDRDLDHRELRQAVGDGITQPETRYVESDGIHIAYQVLGEGPLDIVAVPGLISHLDLWWQDPTTTRFFRRLASLGRLIMFDKRDTGLSDSAPADVSLEQRMDDVKAVMGACGSSRAVLFGYSEGGPMSILFAATYPERVTSLILAASAARWSPADDYPCGPQSIEMFEAFERMASHGWGRGESIDWYAPSRAGSMRARQELARWERMAVSPGSLLRIVRMCREIDVRDVLATIRVPTLIIQREQDRITPAFHSRYLAAHIANARYFEQPGDHLLWLGDTDAMFTQIEQFLAQPQNFAEPDRVLTTIVCIDVIDVPISTNTGARDLPRRDTDNLEIRQRLQSQRGRLIDSRNVAVVASFDGPGRALRCAADIRQAAAQQDIQVRIGVHTGEVEILNEEVTGVSLDIAEMLAGVAEPTEILVTKTVRDLVVGSGITFVDRGSHRLGLTDEYRLFALTER